MSPIRPALCVAALLALVAYAPMRGGLVWIGERDGHEVRHDTDPDAGPWRGLNALFYTLPPGIEELL